MANKTRDKSRRTGLRRIRASTRARLAFGAFFLILLISAVVLLVTVFFRPEQAEQERLDSSLLVEGGSVQLLDSFAQPARVPERVATIRLDGLMILQSGENFATFTIDGITATMIKNDYIGGYRIADITSAGVVLQDETERITLTLTENSLNVIHRD